MAWMRKLRLAFFNQTEYFILATYSNVRVEFIFCISFVDKTMKDLSSVCIHNLPYVRPWFWLALPHSWNTALPTCLCAVFSSLDTITAEMNSSKKASLQNWKYLPSVSLLEKQISKISINKTEISWYHTSVLSFATKI